MPVFLPAGPIGVCWGLAGVAACLCAPVCHAQAVRVLGISDGTPFQMGKMTSMRIA